MIIPPGTTTTWDSNVRDEFPGPEIEYVLTGSVTIRAEGQVQVIRAGENGEPKNLAAGAEVVLGPGDTLIHRLEHKLTWTTGEAPVELIVGIAIANTSISAFVPDGSESPEHKGAANVGPIPTEPSVLRIRRIVMKPDGVVMLQPNVPRVSMIHGGGPGFLGEGSDGSISLKGAKETAIVYVFSIEPAAVGSVAPDFDT